MLDTTLYNNLKFCWRQGYKLAKIKEYLDTDMSLEDIQSAFMYDAWAEVLGSNFNCRVAKKF